MSYNAFYQGNSHILFGDFDRITDPASLISTQFAIGNWLELLLITLKSKNQRICAVSLRTEAIYHVIEKY